MSLHDGSDGFEDALLEDRDPSDALSREDMWNMLLDQADGYRYGLGDSLEDPERALELYQHAARNGILAAFPPLAEMYAAGEGCRPDSRRGLRWLQRGAECGSTECWARLAEIFMGQDSDFDVPRHTENARKSWRNFFKRVNPAAYGDEGRALYHRLCLYVRILSQVHPSERDREVVTAFADRFIAMLSQSPDPRDRDAKIAQVKQTLEEVT